MDDNLPETEKLISSFTNITSSWREVAKSFLETHQWKLNAAVSTFTENKVPVAAAEPNVPNPNDEELIRRDHTPFPNLRISIPSSSYNSSDYSPSQLLLRSLFPSYPSRTRFYLQAKRAAEANPFGRQTIKRRRSDSNENRAIERPEQSSREIVSPEVQEEPQGVVTHIVTSWMNGFTADGSPLKTLDDPENAAFFEIISRLESPRDLGQVRVEVKLIRREEENFSESQSPFHGVGSTLAGTEPPALAASTSLRAKESDKEQSSSLVSGESVSAKHQDQQQQQDQPYEVDTFTVIFWKNGFTVDDSELMSFDDPEDAAFLEKITRLESPRLLNPRRVQVKLIRREEEDFK